MRYNIKICIDAIKENHWGPRNITFFKKYTDKVAFHYGDYHKSGWATEIGLTHPDIARERVEGKPSWRPDIVFTDLGRNIIRENRFKMPRVPRAIYFGDDHRHHFCKNRYTGEGYFQFAKEFEFVFIRQASCLSLYQKRHPRAFWLPHGVQSDHLPPVNTKKRHDVVFVGSSINEQRRKTLEMLRHVKGIDILITQGRMNESAYMKTMALGKIIINKTQTQKEINKRVFEALSTGSLLLTNRVDSTCRLETLFKDKVHLGIYESEQHLIELIKYYLKNEEERIKIAREGQKEALEKHTSEARVKQLLEVLSRELKRL
jgi:spore maturation protein CgeB